MMKTLDEVLAASIEKAGGAIEKAVDFSLEQAPEVIQQAMTWHAVKSVSDNIVAIILVLAPIFILMKYMKSIKDQPMSPQDDLGWYWSWCHILKKPEVSVLGWGGNMGVMMFTPIFVLVGMDMFNTTWLKIWIAPKLWLIEYAASLVK